MQYAVIYSIFSQLNRCNIFSGYRASLADSYTDRRKKKEEEESQKIDDLPVLVTRRSSSNSAMLSSKVNGPVAHGSTQ